MEDNLKNLFISIIVRSGRAEGVKYSTLKRMFGPEIDNMLEKLNEVIKDLGLKVERIKRGNRVVIKPLRPISGVKLTPLDSNALAALTIILSLIVLKQDAVNKEDYFKLMEKKVGRTEAKICLGELIRDGYIEERGGKLFAGWRSEAEVDMERLRDRIVKIIEEMSK